mgnify:CR=1 FL=1
MALESQLSPQAEASAGRQVLDAGIGATGIQVIQTIADKDRVIGELITNLTTVLGTINARDKQFTDLLTTTDKTFTVI